MNVPFKPLQDRVLIYPEQGETETAGGLVLPNASEAPPEGVVVAVGEQVQDLNIGDTVAYSKYGGSTITIDKIEYLVLAEKEVLGRFTD